MAEEIAQKVFTDLARKAAILQRHPALTGWLHRSTRYAAIDAVRSETRRKKLTQLAVDIQGDISHPELYAEWQNLRPVIDEALDNLKEIDRAVMLLRYFDGLSFAEVGARMKLSENTARMRTTRALEKLRVQLSKRGITSSATALGALLANQAVAAAPAGLANSVAMAALAVPPVGVIGSLLAMLAFNKGAALGVGVGLAVSCAGVAWSLSRLHDYRAQLPALQAENARLAFVLENLGQEDATAAPATGVKTKETSADSQADRGTINANETINTSHANHGQATAKDALLSFAWALDTGNATALSELITFSEADRAELERVYNMQPASIRAQFRTPEELMIHFRLVAAVLRPPPNVEILRRFTPTDGPNGRVVLRMPGTRGAGWTMVHTLEGWKVEQPVKGFEAAIRKLLTNEIVVKLGLN